MRVLSRLVLFLLAPLLKVQDVVAQDRLTIGVMAHLTGDFAAWVQAYLEGITLAREHVNSSGGVGGKSVELDIEDTRFNPALTAPLPGKVLQVLKGELEVAR